MAFDINDTSPRDQYTASGGSQTVFTVSFEFLANADLKVYLTPVGNDPDDTADLLTLTTDYTVVGAGSNGTKEITLVVAATDGDVITIVRDDALDRDTEFLSNGDLTIASMNTELNKIITLMQQIEMNQEQRSLMFMRAAQLAGVSLALPAPVADSALVWNSGGTALECQDADTFSGGIQTAAEASATAAANSATASANSATAAANSFDEFDDIYLGAKATAPALDNDGDALQAGALYFNTTTEDLWFYTGSAWQLYNSSAASSANTVSIADSGGHYAGSDVEAALQELRPYTYTVITGSAAQSISIGSLSLAADKDIEVNLSVVGLSAGAIALILNGDTTLTNYDSAYSTDGGAATKANNSAIGISTLVGQYAIVRGVISPNSTSGDTTVTLSISNWDTSAMGVVTTSIRYTVSDTITSIGFEDAALSATVFGIGSRLSIRELN